MLYFILVLDFEIAALPVKQKWRKKGVQEI